MPIIALQKPNLKFFDSFLEAVEEFKQEQMPRYMSFDMGGLQNCFENFVNSENNKKTFWTKDAPVDEAELWAITDQKIFVGSLSIRHKLNQDLTVLGGHIGYETRPSYRNTGIASQMLQLALPMAKQLGISKVLLTCSDDNLSSIRVIEKNGGILTETKSPYDGAVLKRYYWIST